MTRLRSLGFESGSVNEFDVITGAVTINTADARSGTYCASCGSSTHGRVFIPGRRELYIGFGYRLSSYRNARSFFDLQAVAGTNYIHIVSASDTTDSAEVRYGTTVLFSINLGDLLEWKHMEVYCLTDSVEGRIEVKINGVSVGSYDGDLGISEITCLQWGQGSASPAHLVDDIVVNDSLGAYNNSWTGQPRLIPAPITASGSINDWTRGGVDSGANWSQVSPIPASDDGYIETDQADEEDLFEHAAFPAIPEGATINNLIVVAKARVESGTGSFAHKVVSGSMDSEGDIKTLTANFKFYDEAFPVDEGDMPWTLDRINDAEVGIINKEFTP
jgi:hypothetical protein